MQPPHPAQAALQVTWSAGASPLLSLAPASSKLRLLPFPHGLTFAPTAGAVLHKHSSDAPMPGGRGEDSQCVSTLWARAAQLSLSPCSPCPLPIVAFRLARAFQDTSVIPRSSTSRISHGTKARKVDSRSWSCPHAERAGEGKPAGACVQFSVFLEGQGRQQLDAPDKKGEPARLCREVREGQRWKLEPNKES